MTHTPTPWEISEKNNGDYVVYGSGNELVMVDTSYYPVAPSPDNAAFILKAVNNHDKLVEALRAFVSQIDSAILVEDDHPTSHLSDALRDALVILEGLE